MIVKAGLFYRWSEAEHPEHSECRCSEAEWGRTERGTWPLGLRHYIRIIWRPVAKNACLAIPEGWALGRLARNVYSSVIAMNHVVAKWQSHLPRSWWCPHWCFCETYGQTHSLVLCRRLRTEDSSEIGIIKMVSGMETWPTKQYKM